MTRKVRLLLFLTALCVLALGWDWWRHGGMGSGKISEEGMVLTPAQQDAIAPFLTHDADVMVVHFWATWCPPCIVEMPHVLEALQHVPPGVAVAMVSLDKPAPEAFYIKEGITMKEQATGAVSWLNDPQQVRSQALLGKVMLPTTLLVTTDTKRVLARIDGPLSWPPLMAVLRGMIDHNKGDK